MRKLLARKTLSFFRFARDLQELLGYARWENFITAIKRAINLVNQQTVIQITIFVVSRKWSFLVAELSVKLKILCSLVTPATMPKWESEERTNSLCARHALPCRHGSKNSLKNACFYRLALRLENG